MKSSQHFCPFCNDWPCLTFTQPLFVIYASLGLKITDSRFIPSEHFKLWDYISFNSLHSKSLNFCSCVNKWGPSKHKASLISNGQSEYDGRPLLKCLQYELLTIFSHHMSHSIIVFLCYCNNRPAQTVTIGIYWTCVKQHRIHYSIEIQTLYMSMYNLTKKILVSFSKTES